MADINTITEMILAIKAIYPYYAKGNDAKILAQTWDRLLKDYPDRMTDKAFYVCLQTCKVPPTPADVIEKIKEMQKTLRPSDEELWVEYKTAISKAAELADSFNFTAIEPNGLTQGQNARIKAEKLYEGLPEYIKEYTGSYGAFMDMVKTADAAFLTYERNRFLKAMPDIAKRVEYRERLKGSNFSEKDRIGGKKNEF